MRHTENLIRTHAKEGRVFDLEAELINKDGKTVPVFISASVIGLHRKVVIQGIFKDISNEKMTLDGKDEIATKKLIEKVNEILMVRHKIGEKEVRRRL
jgi:hypothetical protein